MHMQFINGIQELGADEATVMILLLIVLFYPERAALEASDCIERVQEKYLLLLNKYVQWRYGPKGTRTFPKVSHHLSAGNSKLLPVPMSFQFLMIMINDSLAFNKTG